jgi:flagellin-specific chaperone FliS
MFATDVRKSYMANNVPQWTRVEMLIELYVTAICHVRTALAAQRERGTAESTIARLKAVRVVQGIAAGVDSTQGEIAANVLRLCEFVQHCLLEGTESRDLEALRILNTLREAFEGIRAEANRLESTGQLPPVRIESAFELHV